MKVLKKKLNISSDVPIVDNETKNDLKALDWDYSQAELCCVGTLHGNAITQHFLLKNSKREETYKRVVAKHLDSLPCPMYAFNRNMEHGNFAGYLGREYPVAEISPAAVKGYGKEQYFKLLLDAGRVDKRVLEENDLQDPLNGDASQVMTRYANEDYDSIIRHNQCCLVKEYFVRQHGDWLRKQMEQKRVSGW